MVVLRRARSPYPVAEFQLRGLKARATYEMRRQSAGETERKSGAELMERLVVTIAERRGSQVITYRAVSVR